MIQTPHVHMVYVRLLTVPPIALGEWSMALVLMKDQQLNTDMLIQHERMRVIVVVVRRHIIIVISYFCEFHPLPKVEQRI